MLTAEQLATLRAMIDERCAALTAEIHGDAARLREETYAALAGPVTDSGDKSAADLLSDLEGAELTRDLEELRRLEAAQERLASGSYGVCVDCGREIGFERLRAQPAALRCVDCQQVYERTYSNPPAPRL